MIIGIAGKARSGKGTIASHIMTRYSFAEDKFSTPIVKVLSDVFMIDEKIALDEAGRENPLVDWPGWTVRSMMQTVATKMREMDTLVFVKAMEKRLRLRLDNLEFMPFIPNIVIHDIRMPNERDLLKQKFGAVIFKVVRDSTGPVGLAGHETESQNISADFIFPNNGSIETLLKMVDTVMQEELKILPSVTTTRRS